MKEVIILSNCVRPYRVAFFLKIADTLARHQVRLRICHDPEAPESVGTDSLPERMQIPVKTTRIGSKACYHHLPKTARHADLVIMSQLASVLTNYDLLFRSRIGKGFRTAFWGHGRNLRPSRSQRLTEWAKKFFSTQVDWWFAYNAFSAGIVRNLGYPSERITEVRNSVDTSALRSARESCQREDLELLKSQMGIDSDQVAVYTGSLTPLKRIDFLLDAAKRIREDTSDFHLIIVGDGPLAALVEDAAAEHPWIHWVGAKHEAEKVPYWALSKLLLMPGGVGLVVIDSFALGVPMVTTANRLHGPEIDYLRDGENGVMVPQFDCVESYAAEVIGLLTNPGRLEHLKAGCLADADEYSIEEMVQRFTNGVLSALEAPRKSRA